MALPRSCAMDTVVFAALLGAVSLRSVGARPQIPNPSGPSASGHATAPMAPAPFTATAPVPLPAPAPASASASAGSSRTFVPILQQHFEQAPDGQYRWSYAAGDGTAQEAVGELTASRAIAVQGSFSYPSPEGQVQVKYLADEFGFQPTGAHIHPAILDAVRRQVEHARAEPVNLYNEAGFPADGQQLAGQLPNAAGAGGSQPLSLQSLVPQSSHVLTALASAPSGSALL